MGDNKEMLNELVGLAANVPAPVQTAFVKTLGRLIGGLTALPEGWVRRRVQAYDDVTNARSAVAAVLAKGVAENALADPVTMQAAAEIYLPNEIRKSKNKVQIAQIAAEEIKHLETGDQVADTPNEDWMNAFIRVAEDASSEDLQHLFARILAGEVVTPGSFSRRTLRAVSELDKEIAETFAEIWNRSVGEEIDYSPEIGRGDLYVKWKMLAECGLMMGDTSARTIKHPVDIPEGGVWWPIQHKDYTLQLDVDQGDMPQWDYVRFTRVGVELGSVLPPPNFKDNIKKVGRSLATRYERKATLLSRDAPPEEL